MAAGNNYRLLLEAQLDPQKVQAQIQALSSKSIMRIRAQFDVSDMKKLEDALDKIRAQASSLDKVTLLGNQQGGINRAVVEYRDALGNVVRDYVKINDHVKITQTYTENLAKDEREVTKIIERRAALTAKQRDEMEKAAHAADRFLARSQNMAGSAQLTKAQDTANLLKQAASAGDIARVRELNKELDLNKAALQGVRAGTDAWSSAMQRAMRQTVAYVASIASIQAVISQFREGIQYVADLNTEMTKIQVLQIEGAQTNEQIADLALQYNTLASEVGGTTLEVARGSVEWLRQGKSIAETSKLLESTLMLSKLGALDTAQSTEYLTAILNGFRMSAEDASMVVDKLIAVDNVAATSAGELATSLQYASAVANDAGVSFENLVAMVGTVSSVTRLAPEMIGTAFRTMMVRMQQVKAGAIDETGQSLNNVEKTLAAVGIRLRDATDSFRPLEDVISDVATQWNTFNEVQKAQIGNAIAGQRQAQIFAVTMQNWAQVQSLVVEQLDSTGLATERYAIYLESVEAAQNRVTVAWERLWQTSVESGMITWWLDFAEGVLNATTAAGGLNTILKLVIINFVAFNAMNLYNGLLMFIATVQQGITALRALGTTATLTGASVSAAFGVIGIVVSAGILIWNAYQSSIETTAEKVARLTDELSTLQTEFDKTKASTSTFGDLAREYVELRENSSRTEQEQRRFLQVQEEIRDILPEVSGHLDEQGNFIIDETESVRSLTSAMNELRDAQLAELQAKAQERIDTETQAYREQTEQLERLIKLHNTPTTGFARDRDREEGRIKEQREEMEKTIVSIKRDFSSLSLEQQKIQLQVLRDIGTWGEQIAVELEQAQNAARAGSLSPDERGGEYVPTEDFVVGEKENEYLGFLETLNDLTEKRASLLDIIAASEAGQLEYSQIKELAEAYPEYLSALSEENGQLQLNTDMVRQYMLSKAEAAVEAARLNGATQEEIAILQSYVDKIRETMYVTLDGAQVTTGAFNEMAWTIANQAAMSGNSFYDMQGKALSSAEAIYQYMTSGDAAFNDFVRQAAAITGQSVQSIMSQVTGSIISAHSTASAAIEDLQRRFQGLATVMNTAAPAPLQLFSPAPTGFQYPGGLSEMNKGGSSGSGSAEREKEREEQERQRKIEQAIENARREAIEGLNEQLKAYKRIIDARKELLDTMQAERRYQDDIAERNKSILKIQSELAELRFDNSEEAKARRLQLKEELAQQKKELQETQREHSLEVQKRALEKQYEEFELRIEKMIAAIETIDATSVDEFMARLAEILTKNNKAKDVAPPPATYHSGADAGFIGGKAAMKSNEEFVRVLKGEVVVNPTQMNQFMNRTLPEISSNAGIGNLEVNMPIHVAGSLDKAVMPDLESLVKKTVKQLNENLGKRGYTRRAESFSI